MKRVEMLAYALMITNCATLTYYEESTLAAFFACLFSAILGLGIIRNFLNWIDKDDDYKSFDS
jgi:hypothetical protein